MPNTVRGQKRVGEMRITNAGGIPRLEETYEFLIDAHDIYTSQFSVSQTPGLPVVNVTPSAFGLTICRSKTVTRDDKIATLWHAVCEFSSEVEEGQDNQDPETDPTSWIPIYETKFERVPIVVTKDFAGKAIANSAGQPFANGLTVTRKLPMWEFYQFEPATVTDEQVIARSEVVNLTSFRGRGTHTLLCTVMSSSIGFYYGSRIRFTRYSVLYDRLNWKHKRLDVGPAFLSGSTIQPYTDAQGNVIEGGLNGSGAKVAVGLPPAILEFEMYDAIDFNSFLRV
jgi:hypothetical protein